LLALVCLAIAHRVRPDWVAVPLSEAAATVKTKVSPQRLSRLTTRAQGPFARTLDTLTRRGRPVANRVIAAAVRELALTRALLDLVTTVLATVKLRRRAVGALVVGAFVRLKAEHPQLTQAQFCQTLALSERTFRAWRDTPVPPDPSPTEPDGPSPPPTPPRERPPRRGRFDFDVTCPGTQVAADTTDLEAFGVPLKLIATQDVGGRDADLLTSILVDDHESADLVARVLRDSLSSLPGAQAIVDQGTPYLAEKTQQALDELEVEPAVQVEGDPLGKATLERAFGSVKRFARPILALTNRVAEAIPALCQVPLARAFTRLVLVALLRAYQHGARQAHAACQARGGADPAAWVAAAETSRELSRAHDRSKRMLLAHIHAAYGINTSATRFGKAFRRFPLSVLQAAERAFATQAHRDDIRNRMAYFAKLVRLEHDAFRKAQARQHAEAAQRARSAERERAYAAQADARAHDPAAHLREALDAIADHWDGTGLLFGGTGPGTAWMRTALARLAAQHGPHAPDVAAGIFLAFERDAIARLGAHGVATIRAVLDRHLAALPPTDNSSPPPERLAAILRRNINQRPPPS
jgi:hypothetical protein